MRNLYTAFSCLLFSINLCFGQQPSNKEADWYSKATAYIAAQDYYFKPMKNGEFAACNPSNHFITTAGKSGYRIIKEKDAGITWQVAFDFISAGRKNMNLYPSSVFQPVFNNGELDYTSNDVKIEYRNSKEGLRQNFIIRSRPAGLEKLTVNIALQSSLSPHLSSDQSLSFYNGHGGLELMYNDLKVWDATGRLLHAGFALSSSNILSIITDDKNAVYPVTIDPLSRSPEWITSADGILPALVPDLRSEALYGYVVKGIGDINNDGYDDVAVGAPAAADILADNSVAKVGAVFIFLGSADGLSTIPYRKLTPNTPVAGSLFGISIISEDITGNTQNDLVIGAPLDTYQTNASDNNILSGGSASATVKAGKVYIFPNENLSSTTVSPSLEVKLQGTEYFYSNTITNPLTGNTTVAETNTDNQALFGYSIAVTEKLSNGNKALVIGVPGYSGQSTNKIKTGAVFVYYSNNLQTIAPMQLETPTLSLAGISTPVTFNNQLFGYSVDGAGDYNGDGNPDVIAGAPTGFNAGTNASPIGGGAYIYYGTGTSIGKDIEVELKAPLVSSSANLFGFVVKGARSGARPFIRNGTVLVGAPLSGAILNATDLTVKTGNVYVFHQTATLAETPAPVQTLSSPRGNNILSILSGRPITLSVLFGASLDNVGDINNDGINDIIVGEPLSTPVSLVGTGILSGATFVYKGNANGTYDPTPVYDVTVTTSDNFGVDAASTLGYSVSGAGQVKGQSLPPRIIVGAPGRALDFGNGVLDLDATFAILLSTTSGSNGIGKALTFDVTAPGVLPVTLKYFTAVRQGPAANLLWSTSAETGVDHFDIERSSDGMTFTYLGQVSATNSASGSNYNFLDATPNSGKNYYRLHIIDRDGKSSYSTVALLNFESAGAATITLMPNPVRSSFNLKLTYFERGIYQLQLYTNSGILLNKRNITITGPDQIETFSRGNLPAGAYLLQLSNMAGNKIKIIKVKVQ